MIIRFNFGFFGGTLPVLMVPTVFLAILAAYVVLVAEDTRRKLINLGIILASVIVGFVEESVGRASDSIGTEPLGIVVVRFEEFFIEPEDIVIVPGHFILRHPEVPDFSPVLRAFILLMS